MTEMTNRVSAARAGIENLRPDEVCAELESAAVMLIDVRELTEWAAGAIAGAAPVPRGILEFWATTCLTADRRVILCSSTGLRSALAAQTLQELGYIDVCHLAGGVAAWRGAGFPLESNVLD